MPTSITSRKAPSGLPAPIEGEAFSLIGTLRRTQRTLTVEDAAELLQVSKKTVYKQINAGKIPTLNLGFDVVRIDPKGWLLILECDNEHLLPRIRRLKAA